MKILLGNNTLDILAGSETWTLTMAKEFIRLGHEVWAYSKQLGFIAMKLEELGVKCVDKFDNVGSIQPHNFVFTESTQDQTFDVIICAHHDVTGYLRKMYPTTPIIATIHGILHKDEKTGQIWPEHPNLKANVDQFVAVSEEVQKTLEDLYQLPSMIIRNPIDLERFEFQPFRYNVEEGMEPKIKTIMLNSNYTHPQDPSTQLIKDAADILGAQVIAIGMNFQSSYEVEEIMKDVDVVVGMGRSVLEGLAMGKIGLCHGRWGTGGVITPQSYKNLAWFNFSGRNSSGKYATAQEIADELSKWYRKDLTEEMYKIIKEECDVKVVAMSYLIVAENLIKGKNQF